MDKTQTTDSSFPFRVLYLTRNLTGRVRVATFLETWFLGWRCLTGLTLHVMTCHTVSLVSFLLLKACHGASVIGGGGGCGDFFLACEDFGGVFDHSFPACACFLWFLLLLLLFLVEISSRILIPLFYARISPQWLIKLRRLWPKAPWQVACELVSW